MKTEREIFAENLTRIIESNPDLNKAKIAAELGVSRGTMSDYTNAKAYPRPAKMAKLCEILGVSQYDLTTSHYEKEDGFVPNREVLSIAKEIYKNPEIRKIYHAIMGLSANEIQAIRTLLTTFEEGKRGCE